MNKPFKEIQGNTNNEMNKTVQGLKGEKVNKENTK
jgi:hypothetical protein